MVLYFNDSSTQELIINYGTLPQQYQYLSWINVMYRSEKGAQELIMVQYHSGCSTHG
jgi:hypothetical protein